MSFQRILPVAAVAIACAVAPVQTQAQPLSPDGEDEPLVMVFPIASTLPVESFVDSSPQLTYVVVRESENRGWRVSVAKSSFADTMMLVGCAGEGEDCYGRMLEQIGAKEAIYGTVAPAQEAGKVDIELRRMRKSAPPTIARYTVQADSMDALVSELDQLLPPFLDAPARSGDARSSTDRVAGSSFSVARVRPSSWILVGSGAAATVTGVVLWSLASAKQSEIADAPTATRADLERLVELEDSAGRYATIGNVVLAGGLIATTIGAVLMVRQGRATVPEDTSVTIAPMAASGGMGLTVTLEWP